MKTIFYTMILLLVLGGEKAQAQLNFSTRVVKDSLFIPWEIIYGPDNHIWFTQKNGYICRLDPTTGHTDTLYHEANTYIMGSGEGGMLGMALDPNFNTTPYVYVTYEYLQSGTSNYRERVVRYTYGANALSNPQILIDNITGANFHNGGRILIVGDKLFISTGDATVGSNAQDIQSLNGKILRINLDGTIPADNPIPGSPVWDWGHRNAEGLVYANGKLYSSEHGPDTDDEINILVSGRNYGWPTVAGFCDLPAEQTFCTDSNVVEPLYAWTPTIATCGLDYYDHPMFPSLQGSLLLATLKDMHLYQLVLNAAKDSIISAQVLSGISFGRLRDICISPSGSIFISTSNSDASGTGAKVDRIIEIYDASSTVVNILNEAGIVTLYPNPVKDDMNLWFGAGTLNKEWHYHITNTQGQVLKEGKLLPQSANQQIFTSNLPSGVYFFSLWNNRKAFSVQRFVKF